MSIHLRFFVFLLNCLTLKLMQLKLTIFLPRRVFWLNVGVAVCCNELLRQTYNLGSGVGVSVLQLLRIFEKTTGTTVPYEMKPRREGDIISIYSDGTRAKQELGWTTRYSLEQMCKCSGSPIFSPKSVFIKPFTYIC